MRWTAVLVLCCVVLLLTTCRGSNSLPADSTRNGAAYLQEQLRLLESLPVPGGVLPALWFDLKASLRTQLQARLDSGRMTLGVPDSNLSQAALVLDTPGQLLSWRYANQGDYDQNSEVNIADLTPIAQHFQASTSGAGPFVPDSIDSVVDGDNNGEINLADITPIAQNLGNILASYKVYTSTAVSDLPSGNTGPNGAGATLLGTVAQGDGTGDPKQTRLSYSLPSGTIAAGSVFWVRPNDAADGTGSDGTPSSASGPGAPPVATVELFQLDIERADQTFPDTDWGEADVSFTGVSGVLYFSMTCNGVEVLRNIPLVSNRGAGLPHTVSIPFSLGVPSGTAVSSCTLDYSLAAQPKAGSSARQASIPGPVPVVGRTYGQLVEGGLYSEPPPPAENTLSPVEPVAAYASQDFEFPNQECGKGEVTAAAVSNSLEYLRERHNLDIGASSGKLTDIATMRLACSEEFEDGKFVGAPSNWALSKDVYMQQHGYPIQTTQTNDMNEAMAALSSGCDVEVQFAVLQGLHISMAVTGLSLAADGTLSIQTQSDTRPGAPGGLASGLTKFKTGTTGLPAGILTACTFVIECPVVPPAWHEQPVVDFAFSPELVELPDGDMALGFYNNVNDDQDWYMATVSATEVGGQMQMLIEGGADQIDTAPAIDNAGQYGDIALDSAGGLHTVFSEEFPNYGLWYATLPDGAPAWSTPVSIEDTATGVHGVSLAIDGTTPQCSYFVSSDLHFARADGVGGFTVITNPVSTSSFGNQLTSLLNSAGMPTILYVNNTNLKAARAQTADGLAAWTDLGTVLIDNLNQSYLDADMVSGRCAAVVCTDTGDMLYCRAAADDCTSWDAPVSCSGGVAGACRPSLEVCTWEGSEVPCVSFTGGQDVNNKSYFNPALDGLGTGWPPVPIEIGLAAPVSFNLGQTSLINSSSLGLSPLTAIPQAWGTSFHFYF